MASLSWGSVGRFGSLLLLGALAPMPALGAMPHDLCGSFNTADTDRNTSIYQTNGLCSDFCKDDFAWAITQDEDCWCSDFTPSKGSQVGKDRCDTPCPAYPEENCGGRGLFAYIELKAKAPEGTKGPEAPTTKTDSDTETTSTFTTDGTIRTVTVMPTNEDDGDADGSANGGSDGDSDDSGGGGLGTGAVVGIVVGVIAAVLIAAGAVLFWFFKRRKRNQQEGYEGDPSVRGDSSDRMGSAHPEMSMGAGRGGSPSSNVGGSSSNRNSTLAIDPRMDPFKQGLYMRNHSQESINTLRDDHDYSRRIQQPKVLRATNPDPDQT